MIGFSLFMWAWQVEPRRVETVTTALEVPQWKEKGGSPLRIVIAGDFHLRPNGGDRRAGTWKKSWRPSRT